MKYRLIIVAIVIGLLGLVSAIAYAQNTPVPTETPETSSVIQEDIFVRGGPGRDYLPVGKLLAGDRVRPLSRNAAGDWVLIVYGKGYGWIRRDLAFWVENIDTLPIVDVANLTPSPVLPTTPSATPILLPTFTPVGNWVQLNNDAQSGFVRAGPGRTYLRLGQLFTGDAVEPVSQNADGSWIMIRYGEGFGWISRNLVLWVDDLDSLPVVSVDNLTPSATFTATNTETHTPTATSTLTPTSTPSVTPTLTASYTLTTTPSLTFTLTPVPTLTATPVPSATNTLIPSSTATATLTPTLEPSSTSTASATATLTPTIEPTSTPTATETLRPTLEPSSTSTAS
ncbi:MAG: SH3 domain-containing protein, partial [Anaerolineaceae bacterium]|nr:SH3 domain-containing protein [Anaerolineaceae bacterium]